MEFLASKLFFKGGNEGLNNALPGFFEFKVKDIRGKQFSFEYLKQKKLTMIMNVACHCGYTSQNYKDMVKTHEEYKNKGFEVIVFPCNQFGGQESGSPEEIEAFVKNNFNAKFPIMEKIEVNGEKTHPVYAYLRNNSSLYDPTTKMAKKIPWNFSKFFVNGKGEVIQFYAPTVKSEEVLAFIQKELSK